MSNQTSDATVGNTQKGGVSAFSSFETDVRRQIEHMIAFIHQEAMERVHEINAKAEEEFNIEKGRLVQQERIRIIKNYEKKEKQINSMHRIQNSRVLNKARLEKLKTQDEIINRVFEETQQKLLKQRSDVAGYKALLEKLLLQSLFQLMEDDVTVFCLKEDVKLVEQLLEPVKKQFLDKVKAYVAEHKVPLPFGSISLTLNRNEFLAESECGGIAIASRKDGGKIKVRNTLTSRLSLIWSQFMPNIRDILFGLNSNRVFKD